MCIFSHFDTEHVVCLGESRLSQVNNSPRGNVFPAGVANFGKSMYRSLERSTQDTRDAFFFVQCPGLIFLAARWSGPATSASIFSAFLDYILRVCQSLRDSFFYLGKLHWFLYLLLSYYYDPGMFIFCWSSNFVEKVVLNESITAKMASRVSPTLYIIIVFIVTLNKLLQIITKLRWNNKDNNN